MANIKRAHTTVIQFLKTEIWRLDKSKLSGLKSILLKPLQILVLAMQKYMRDNCALRASALTFYTLLSVVPVAAMAFGIAKGFGLEQRLENQIYQRLVGQEEVAEKVISFARSLLANTQGGLIAGIGVAILFWSAIKVLNHIEDTFNEIWQVKSRSFIRKFTDYLAIMIISPLLITTSSSVNVYIMTQVTAITGKLALLKMASPLIFLLLKLLPFGLIWLLFILIYIVMPNTRVQWSSALIAGIIGAFIFQVTQGVYIHAQVLLSKYNAIYGSFAALPFFLIWLQLSWTIVLIGAQIAYAHQHVNQHAMRVGYREISSYERKANAINILRLVIANFEQGGPPLKAVEISSRLELPPQLVTRLIWQLINSDLIAAVNIDSAEEFGYLPARDIHHITVVDALSAIDKSTPGNDFALESKHLDTVSEVLKTIEEESKRSKTNLLIKDIEIG